MPMAHAAQSMLGIFTCKTAVFAPVTTDSGQQASELV
jgi:hypothetical protein